MTPLWKGRPDLKTAEEIRLHDTSKRIEEDFGFEDDWMLDNPERRMQAAGIMPQGIWWTSTPVVPSVGNYDLSLVIQYAPEIMLYKLQLKWRHEAMRQPIVRYENRGRHADVCGPHLNWGHPGSSARPVDKAEVPTDDLFLAVRCFCGLPDVNIVLIGRQVWIPAD